MSKEMKYTPLVHYTTTKEYNLLFNLYKTVRGYLLEGEEKAVLLDKYRDCLQFFNDKNRGITDRTDHFCKQCDKHLGMHEDQELTYRCLMCAEKQR